MSGRRVLLRFVAPYFLLFTVFGVASPYLQIMLRGLGFGPAAVGFLLGLYEAVGIAGPLAVARAADRRGAYRPALAFSTLAVLVALPCLVLARGLAAAAASAALLALGLKSLIPIMDTAAVAVVGAAPPAPARDGRPPRAGAGYGSLRAVGTLGFVAMVLLLQATGLGRRGPRDIALWLGGSSLVFGASLFLVPEGPGRRPAGPRGGGTRRIDGTFALGLAIIALSRLAMAPIASFFSLYVTEGLRWDAVGFLWALSAGSEIPVMLLSARLVARFGSMPSIALSSAAVVARLLTYALFPSHAGAIAGQLLHSVCFGLFHPAAVAFVAERVPPERRATGMALYMGIGMGLPTFVGSAAGGLILEATGYATLFASFSAAAVAAIALWALTRRRFEAVRPRPVPAPGPGRP